MKTSTIFLLLSLAFLGIGRLCASPALVANASLKDQTLDPEEVKAVLLGKKVTLGNTRLVVVIAKTGTAQESFLKSKVGMSTSQFQNHWRRLFMTGCGSAPKMADTEAEACKLVMETPGAITITEAGSSAGLIILAAAK